MNKMSLSILGAFFSSRILCSIFVYLGHLRRPYLQEVPGGWIGIQNWWLNPWTTYDTYWYLEIATTGYLPKTTAFFPLYPLLLKFFGADAHSMALSGVLFSHLALLAALFLVYKITVKEHGDRLAHITVWVICFFPSAPFFGSVYPESLFLLLLAGTFLAAREKRWYLCALLAFAAALTRNPGVLIAVTLYIELKRNNLSPSIRWSVISAPLIAFAGVQLYFWWSFGDPFSGVISQEHYNRSLNWPWQPLFSDIFALFHSGHEQNFYLITATSTAVTVIALFTVFCKRQTLRLEYVVLIVGITLMNLIYARELAPATISGVRYMGSLYPFSQLLAIVIYSLHKLPVLLFALASLQLFLFIMFSYYFGWKVIF